MSYFKTCPHCGAHLDPGEVCDCVHSRYARLTPENKEQVIRTVAELLSKQKAAQSAANTQGGEVEHVGYVVSTSNDT